MHKILYTAIITLYTIFTSFSYDNQSLYQISTIDALLSGLYDGTVTLKSLHSKGNFGIGTYDKLNGEMVLLDGKFYRIESSGVVSNPSDNESTPFAAVTFFKADTALSMKNVSMKQCAEKIDSIIATKNMFYAIKITGKFSNVKTRSVPSQEKPYRLLNDIVKTQPTFQFDTTKGTITGFRCPPYVKGINVPGYHLHFIDDKLKGGGHVLDYIADSCSIQIDEINSFSLNLPETKDFYSVQLDKDRGEELKRVESKKE